MVETKFIAPVDHQKVLANISPKVINLPNDFLINIFPNMSFQMVDQKSYKMFIQMFFHLFLQLFYQKYYQIFTQLFYQNVLSNDYPIVLPKVLPWKMLNSPYDCWSIHQVVLAVEVT